MKNPKGLYGDFLLLKPEIEEKINLIKSQIELKRVDTFPSVISEAENALLVINEDSQLLSLYNTHIASIVSLLIFYKKKLKNLSLDELEGKILNSLKKTHSHLLENPSKLLEFTIIDSLFNHFLKLKKKIQKGVKKLDHCLTYSEYYNALINYNEIESKIIKNKPNTLTLDQLFQFISFFSHCIVTMAKNSKIIPLCTKLENNLFEIIDKIYNLYNQPKKLYYEYLDAVTYHLLHLFGDQKVNFETIHSVCRLFISLKTDNELFQYKKMIDFASILNHFRIYLTFLYDAAHVEEVNNHTQDLLDLVVDLANTFENIPDEYYLFYRKEKADYYAGIASEIVVNSLFCMIKQSSDFEEKNRHRIETIIDKLEHLIKKNHALELKDTDTRKILDTISQFIKLVQAGGFDYHWIINRLLKLADPLTSKNCSPQTRALRDYIVNFKIQSSTEDKYYQPYEMLENNPEKLKTLSSKGLLHLKILKKSLNKINSAKIAEYNFKSNISFEQTRTIRQIYEKKLTSSENITHDYFGKLCIFFLEILSGLTCLPEDKDVFLKKETILLFVEETLNLFKKNPDLENSKFRAYHLQFLNYFLQKEINVEKIEKCLGKIIDFDLDDIPIHRSIVHAVNEISVENFNSLVKPLHQIKFNDFIYKLANKYLDLVCREIITLKKSKDKGFLLIDLCIKTIFVVTFFSSMSYTNPLRSDEPVNHRYNFVLLNKLASIILPFKMILILDKTYLQILKSLNGALQIPEFIKTLKKENLAALLHFARIFYREGACKNQFPALEFAFIKLKELETKEEKFIKNSTKTDDLQKIIDPLEQSLINKNKKAEDLKYTLKQLQTGKSDHQKKREQLAAEITLVEEKLNESHKNHDSITQKNRQEKMDVNHNHQINLKNIQQQHAEELKTLKSSNSRRLQELQNQIDESNTALSQIKNKLENTRRQLKLCESELNSQKEALSQTEIINPLPDKRIQLKETHLRLLDFKKTLESSQLQIINRDSQISHKKSSIAKVKVKTQKLTDKLISLEKELKSVEENIELDQAAHQKALESLEGARNSLLQPQWQPGLFGAQTAEVYEPAQFLIYYNLGGT